MLLKKISIDGVEYYRRGIGYFIRLTNIIKKPEVTASEKAWILETYTNIKPKVRYILKGKYEYIIRGVIDFNVRHTEQTKAEETEGEQTNHIATFIDLLCHSYGWTIDYILENVDIFQAEELTKAILKREKMWLNKLALVQHNPGELNRLLDGTETHMSTAEALDRVKHIKPRKRNG
jgi:hypothetical protein